MSFRVGGLATGLDTHGIIEQMLKLERQPVARIESRLRQVRDQQQAWRNIGQRLDDMSGVVSVLQNKNNWSSLQAASSNEDILTASVGMNAPEGTWQVAVERLAESRIVASERVENISVGSFSINGARVDIDEGMSLQDLVRAVNSAGQPRVDVESASDSVEVLESGYTGSEDAQYRFVVSGNNVEIYRGDELLEIREGALVGGTGVVDFSGLKISFTESSEGDSIEFNAIAAREVGVTASAVDGRLVLQGDTHNPIEFTDPDNVLGSIGLLDGEGNATNVLQEGHTSRFTVNGLVIERDSNTVDDVLEGVTLNLASAGSGPISLTVEKDVDELVSALKELVDKQNGLLSHLRNQTAAGRVLNGDSMAGRLGDSQRRLMSDGFSGELRGLADIGITTTDRYGTLSLDENALRSVLMENPDAAWEIIGGKEGLGSRLKDNIDQWSASRGLIKGRIDSTDSSIRRFNRDIEQAENRVAMREQQLWRQFTAMERALSSLQSQGDWLSGQIAGLPGFQRPK